MHTPAYGARLLLTPVVLDFDAYHARPVAPATNAEFDDRACQLFAVAYKRRWYLAF